MKFIPLLLLTMSISFSAQATTFKIATLSAEGQSWMRTMRAAAGDIEKETEGRVKIKFYPGGVMGSDNAVLRKIRIRQLHGAALSGGSLARFYKDAEVYSLPLKFRSFEEVDYVRERMDESIVNGFEKGGFVTFGLAEGGLAYMMTDAPVKTVAELKKKKVWIPSGDAAALKAVQAFDISPFPLELPNVLVSLQTGMINTVATSPIAAIALQWHTQVEYITDVPLLYFFAVLAIDKKAFSKLSTSDQATMRRIMGGAFKAIDEQNRKDNIGAFAALQSQGLKLVPLDREEIKNWYKRADNASKKMIEDGIVSKEAADKLDHYLQEFRGSQNQNAKSSSAMVGAK